MTTTLQYMREMFREKLTSLSSDYKDTKADADSFAKLQKSQVLQEARCFNDSQIQERKCRSILAKLIYLINQGEIFTEFESQSLFFSITKLLQSNHLDLRRMIYLMIKEFRLESSMYIVTSSLVKDISSKQDLFRMNALRIIPLVLDSSNLVQIERYIKTAIIDKNYAISSAALLSGMQLLSNHDDLVRKWSNEINDRLNSKNINNHYHALILLHEIKKNDKNSFTKVLINCTNQQYSQLATIQIIRFTKEILNLQELDMSTEKSLIDFLQKQIHKSQEVVIFEACKALCELKQLSNKDLVGVISVLSIFFVSQNTIFKFITLRIINKLISNPIRKTLISQTGDIEAILNDNNKSLSSLAVSVLLKLCKEDNVEKLLNQIQENMSDMSDEFKIDILRSIKNLIKTIPSRSKTVLSFLQNCLKSDGNYDFKKYTIDIIEMMINEVAESKDSGLIALAEYIEDCQYQHLQLQVLSILNREASKKAAPKKVIRFINNRIHLEDSEIRAAAIGTIGKFGLRYPELKDNVVNLLKQTLDDPDEEVRDRGFFTINQLTMKDQTAAPQFQKNLHQINLEEIDQIEKYVQVNLQQLNRCNDENYLSQERISKFVEENKGLFKSNYQDEQTKQLFEGGFEIDNQVQSTQQQLTSQQAGSGEDKEQEEFYKYNKLFSENQIFSQYGQLRSMSTPIKLTEGQSEYIVILYKFFFDDYIVLEYRVKNTLSDQILKNVTIKVTFTNDNLKEANQVPAAIIKPNETSNVLIGIAKNPECMIVTTQATSILVFTASQVNSNTSYQDDFQLEDFSINLTDFIVPLQVPKNKFNVEWECYQNAEEVQQAFKLDYKNTDFAIQELVKHFGMSICENSDKIQANNKLHTLLLSGSFMGLQKVLIQCTIAFDANMGCVLKMKVKSESTTLSENLIESLQQ